LARVAQKERKDPSTPEKQKGRGGMNYKKRGGVIERGGGQRRELVVPRGTVEKEFCLRGNVPEKALGGKDRTFLGKEGEEDTRQKDRSSESELNSN